MESMETKTATGLKTTTNVERFSRERSGQLEGRRQWLRGRTKDGGGSGCDGRQWHLRRECKENLKKKRKKKGYMNNVSCCIFVSRVVQISFLIVILWVNRFLPPTK
jgi:hypothetical protein